MRRFPVLAAVVLSAVVLCATPASADTSCAAGSICTITLTQSNVSQLAGIVITVTINNTGSNTVISFQLTSSPVTNSPIGIDMVGWGGKVSKTGPSASLLSTSSTNFGGNQAVAASGAGTMDGFGSFAVQGNHPAGTGGITSAITFTLAGLVTTFPDNDFMGTGAGQGNEFAVHIRFGNNCSGFVGGVAGPASTSSDPNCTVVPEPGTLALFGAGLLGVAGVFRRRLS